MAFLEFNIRDYTIVYSTVDSHKMMRNIRTVALFPQLLVCYLLYLVGAFYFHFVVCQGGLYFCSFHIILQGLPLYSKPPFRGFSLVGDALGTSFTVIIVGYSFESY